MSTSNTNNTARHPAWTLPPSPIYYPAIPFPAPFAPHACYSDNERILLSTINWWDPELRMAMRRSWGRTIAALNNDEDFARHEVSYLGYSREVTRFQLERQFAGLAGRPLPEDESYEYGPGDNQEADYHEHGEDDRSSPASPQEEMRDGEVEDYAPTSPRYPQEEQEDDNAPTSPVYPPVTPFVSWAHLNRDQVATPGPPTHYDPNEATSPDYGQWATPPPKSPRYQPESPRYQSHSPPLGSSQDHYDSYPSKSARTSPTASKASIAAPTPQRTWITENLEQNAATREPTPPPSDESWTPDAYIPELTLPEPEYPDLSSIGQTARERGRILQHGVNTPYSPLPSPAREEAPPAEIEDSPRYVPDSPLWEPTLPQYPTDRSGWAPRRGVQREEALEDSPLHQMAVAPPAMPVEGERRGVKRAFVEEDEDEDEDDEEAGYYEDEVERPWKRVRSDGGRWI